MKLKKRSPEELAVAYKWLIEIIIVYFIIGAFVILIGKVIPSLGEWITKNIWTFIIVFICIYAISGFIVGLYLGKKLEKEKI